MKNILKRSTVKKVLRIVGIIVIIIVIIAAITASMNNKPSNAEKVWDSEMTIGNPEAKNYFIIYSDLVCPYCVAFENAIIEHEDEFKKYVEENDIFLEVRVSDFLYEYGETRPINSRYSAVATYCAKNEGKFWDYYDLAITTVWNDFFESSGKAAVSKMQDLGKEYWIKIGKKLELSEDFENCVKNDEPIKEIEKNAEKTAKLANGMPYFKFNNYTTSGFDLSWGWEYVQMYFQAGLES